MSSIPPMTDPTESRPSRWRRAAVRGRRWFRPGVLALGLALLAWFVGVQLDETSRVRPVAFDCAEQATLVIRRHDDADSPPSIAYAPSQEQTFLPVGQYDVATYRAGSLSPSFRIDVTDGDWGSSLDVPVDLVSTQFTEPLELPTFPQPVDLGPRHGLLTFTARGIALHAFEASPGQGRTWRTAWSVDFVESPPAATAQSPGLRWPSLAALAADRQDEDSNFARPWVGAEFVDLDGDRCGDVVLAARHQAFVCALSGRTGEVLWFVPRGDELALAPPSSETKSAGVQRPRAQLELASSVLDRPLIVGDVDHDGAADLFVNSVRYVPGTNEPDSDSGADSTADGDASNDVLQTLELLSGRTGRTIWKVDVPRSWRVRPGSREDRSYWSRSWRTSDEPGQPRPWAEAEVGHPAQLVRRGDAQAVAFAIGSTIHVLDLETGRECAEPFVICPDWSGAPRWCDLDGDRYDDCVVAFQASLRGAVDDEGGSDDGYFLLARSWREPRTLWQLEAGETFAWIRFDLGIETSCRPSPHVGDLDGDGRSEVFVVRPATRPNKESRCAELLVQEGLTGKVLWSRRVPWSTWHEPCPEDVLAGPDIDRDGVRDLLWASRSDATQPLAIDALSGANGATVWRWLPTSATSERRDSRPIDLARFGWWNTGADGWPQCYVHMRPQPHEAYDAPADVDAAHRLETFSAGTGRLVFSGAFIDRCLPIDLDHDGQAEFLTWGKPFDATRGWLQITRGDASTWRTPAPWSLEVTTDVDHDSVGDVAVDDALGRSQLHDGATGDLLAGAQDVFRYAGRTRFVVPTSVLRDARSGAEPSRFNSILPTLDLNADGVSDWLLTSQWMDGKDLELLAAQGQNGRVLWKTILPVELRGHRVIVLEGLSIQHFDGDGTPDFLAVIRDAMEDSYDLVAISGADGRRLWSCLAWKPSDLTQRFATPLIADVDGDAQADVVFRAASPSGDTADRLTALRGSNGNRLWSHPFLAASREPLDGKLARNYFGLQAAATRTSPAAHAVAWWPRSLDGDAEENSALRLRWRFEAFDLRTGASLWTWDHPAECRLAELKDYLIGSHRPQVVAWHKIKTAIALAVWIPSSPDVWWELDSSGATRSHPVPVGSRIKSGATDEATKLPANNSRLWSFDGDGDDLEELLVYDYLGSRATAWNPRDPGGPSWSRTLAPFGDRRIDFAALPTLAASRGSSRATWLVGLDESRSTLLGLDLHTGHDAWRCPLPSTGFLKHGRFGMSPIRLLGNSSADETPFVLLDASNQAIVNQAIRATPPTPDAAPAPSSHVASAARRSDDVLTDDWQTWGLTRRFATWRETPDPRWRRPLPWIPGDDRNWTPPRHAVALKVLRFLAARRQALGLALGCVVLPGWYLMSIVRRRQFHLRQLLLLPLIIGLYLTAWRVTTGSADAKEDAADALPSFVDQQLAEFSSGDVAQAIGYAGPVAAALVLCVAIARRRGRTLGVFVVGWLAASVLLAAGLLAWDVPQHGFWPDVHYDPSGWPWIGWDGAFVAGWGYVVFVPARATFTWLRLRTKTWFVRRGADSTRGVQG